MFRKSLAVVAASALVATVALTPTPAAAYWRGGYVGGAVVGGALLGLGVGALLSAPYVAPPVVYAPPPPPYYYPPAYAYAPYYRPYYRPY